MANWNKLFDKAKPNQSVEFLIDGAAYYNALIKDFQDLKEGDSLLIMGWMFEHGMYMVPNAPNTTPIHYLTLAKGQKVNVAVMIWDNPLYHQVNAASVKSLKAAGIEVELESSRFHTSKPTQALLLRAAGIIKGVSLSFIAFTRINSSWFNILHAISAKFRTIEEQITYFHKKAFAGNLSVCSYHDKVTLIVKNGGDVIAYCGGIDYNHNRLNNSMHDVQCRVVGPAAHSILSKFIAKWNEYPRAGKTNLKAVDAAEQKPASAPAVYALAVGTENYSKPVPEFHRTFKDAFLKIIDNAEKYIYIEDQYLVSTVVVEHINKRLKANPKLLVVLMFQNDEITNDELYIGARKRKEMIAKLTAGVSTKNIHFYSLNNSSVKSIPEALHSKVLIVDDEIAIIGSGNVNRRSFTHDSETSLVVFDDHPITSKFAKRLRVAIWTKYAGGAIPKNLMESWDTMFTAATFLPLFKAATPVPQRSPVVIYKPDITLDKDVAVQPIQIAAEMVADYLPAIHPVLGALRQLTPGLLDNVFEHLADPEGPTEKS